MVKPRIRWQPEVNAWACGTRVSIGWLVVFGKTPEQAYLAWTECLAGMILAGFRHSTIFGGRSA